MVKNFINVVLSNSDINELYQKTYNMDKAIQKQIIAHYLFNKYDMAFSTAERRSSSLIGWFKWIERKLEEDECNGNK